MNWLKMRWQAIAFQCFKGLILVKIKNTSGRITRKWKERPINMVIIYLPTALKTSIPELATAVVIRPNTPMGSSAMMP